jgi:COP9 signalosome complex subunit 5
MSKPSIENEIITNEKKLYTYDDTYQEKYLESHPWTKDETHFKKVYLSTLSAMKIVDHAIRGGKFEICGYLMGFAYEGIFFVLDAVEMPLIGTDSRVEIAGQMGDKANVYSMNYLELMEKVGRGHKYIGWYHSHPGFGCWLSGIDCNTQKYMQTLNKTWFALVVDPYRTKSNKKIDFGCFRMYNNENGNRSIQEFDSIPLNRADEFGIHQSKYYRMPHYFFQSKYESNIVRLMYKNYWVDTLSSNALLVNDDFYKETIEDLTAKMKAYNVRKKAEDVCNKNLNEIHQKKLDDLSNIHTQANVNLQNELIKGIIFRK